MGDAPAVFLVMVSGQIEAADVGSSIIITDAKCCFVLVSSSFARKIFVSDLSIVDDGHESCGRSHQQVYCSTCMDVLQFGCYTAATMLLC